MKKLIAVFILALASLNAFAQASMNDDLLSSKEFEAQMRDASNRAAAQTNLSFCSANVSANFYNWGCEKAIKQAIRANIELESIITKLVFKAMTSVDGLVFNEDNVDEQALAKDIHEFVSKIGRINEANIDEVSARINDEAQHLGRLHYSYSN